MERIATPALPVVSAIAWHLRVGGGWRALPSDMPPGLLRNPPLRGIAARWRTVHGWFRRWLDLGLFDRLLCDVACLRRRVAGRRKTPQLGIVHTQSVNCLPVRGPRGHDAGKRVLGRRRVALVDADGNWLAVAVVPASVQERDTLPALNAGKTEWPSLREVIVDGAFRRVLPGMGQLLKPIGVIPPVEAETAYYNALEAMPIAT